MTIVYLWEVFKSKYLIHVINVKHSLVVRIPMRNLQQFVLQLLFGRNCQGISNVVHFSYLNMTRTLWIIAWLILESFPFRHGSLYQTLVYFLICVFKWYISFQNEDSSTDNDFKLLLSFRGKDLTQSLKRTYRDSGSLLIPHMRCCSDATTFTKRSADRLVSNVLKFLDLKYFGLTNITFLKDL